MAQRARRRPFRRRSHRRKWLDALYDIDPELAAELEELKRYHAHEFRKRILKLAWEHDLQPRPARQPPRKIAGVDVEDAQVDFDHELVARQTDDEAG